MYALLFTQDSDEKALLSLVLQRAGLAVTAANDVERALCSWPERPADLIVWAQSRDPLADVRQFRTETMVPIIVIAHQVDEESHYKLLDAGADLVIFRPFSTRLLIAQTRALLRRAGGIPLSNLPTMSMAGLTLDPATRGLVRRLQTKIEPEPSKPRYVVTVPGLGYSFSQPQT